MIRIYPTVLLFIIQVVLLSSCGSNYDEYLFVKTAISESKSARGVELPMDREWTLSLGDKVESAIVYFIDSGCSACILEFIKFNAIMQRLDDSPILYVVFNQNHEDILKYYFSIASVQYGMDSKIKLLPVEDYYPYGNGNSSSRFIIMRDDKLAFGTI